MSLLRYRVPLAPENSSVTEGLHKPCAFLLKYLADILYLEYHVNQKNFSLPLPSVAGDEVMLV